ncbi:hypothetical protein [Candidatus Clostridium radicumherbarum]|uniref:RiboL-PSP-HEPN domain-containing protein n=1 Tax=Candidatus Clostridium radicumherbarum TaxID=3381662 RepID=A0ABW8TXH0_9CLOT
MLIITESEIMEYTKKMFIDDGEIIIGKHNVFKGERDFALCMIEQTVGLLERTKINDEFVIQYLQGLISLSRDELHHYEEYLKAFSPNNKITEIAMQGEKLSKQDKRVLAEIMESNLAEYTMKGEYQSCCYTAMKAFLIAAYCILFKDINFCIGSIDMIADLDDELQSINIYEAEHEADFIMVDWHSSNKINSMYMLYKTQYPGLDKSSVLDLVAADVIEEDYYFKDERFSIAPSILVKQYCSIIEHEVNEIIKLLNFKDNPHTHLMWNDMKVYVKKHDIDLESTNFELKDLLDNLHRLRNKASHGSIITKKEYETITQYKCEGLFNGLSIKKLEVRNKKVSPSIEEISKYMGF